MFRCSDNMRWILILLNVLGCLQCANGQGLFSQGCWDGWHLHDTKCYRFAYDELLFYEEAEAYCWSFGGKLVTVTTYSKHRFIVDYLIANDVVRAHYWYTGGMWYEGRLSWDENDVNTGGSGGFGIENDPTYWITEPVYRGSWLTDIRYRVVYVYGGGQFQSFGWTNVTSSTLGYPICEVPREFLTELDISDRDLDYGLGASEPKTIQKGPVMGIQPENIVMLKTARTIEFACRASGNPIPKYKWYYGDRFSQAVELQSTTRRTLSGNTLVINNPQEVDVGSYHCRAENEVGEVISNKGDMILGSLGGFSNIAPQAVYASSFRGAKIDCDTPAYNPAVAFSWFEDKADNLFIWPSHENLFVSHSGSLYMSEVQPTDRNKRYFCVVSLIASAGYKLAKANTESRTNRGFLLRLSDDSTSDSDYGPIINVHAFPTPALKGYTIRLECVAYGSRPLKYYWSREGGQNFVEGTEISALGRVLTIKNAPISAEGNYICTCVRGGGSGSRAHQVISVLMEAKPYFPYPLKNKLVDPGMDITWNCKAVARPAATYTWYKNGQILQPVSGKITVRRNVLEILAADEDDEGMYQCAATNSHGTNFTTGQLKVLSFPPNFKRFPLPERTISAAGSNITIPCHVEAAPIPEVTWMKNGGNLNVMPGDMAGNRIGMDRRYGLIISKVEYSDAGVYTCKATNTLGEAASTTRLVVAQGVQWKSVPGHEQVLVNKTAFFFCEAMYSAEYDLSYIWRFNDRPIDFKLMPEYVHGRRNNIPGLYILNPQYKNEGEYTCEARTTMGSKSASARLQVLGPPGPPAGLYPDDYTVTSRSVRLVWTTSNYIHHGGPITQYDFEAETHYEPGVWKTVATDVPEYYVANEALQSAKRKDQRAYTLDNLIPNTNYRFRVRAVNVYGRGKEASKPTSTVKISATEPVLAPRNVGGGGGTVGSLTMTWDPLEISEHCGPGIGYMVYWKLKGDTRDWKKEDEKTRDERVKQGVMTVIVGEDNYYLQYQFKVAAINDIGHGPNSSVATVFSAMGMPSATPIAYETSAINGTAIEVFWEPVPDDREHMKGRVAGYRIHYYENLGPEDYNAIEMSKEPDPNVVGMLARNVYGQQGSAIIIGLTPNNEQFVRVQVFNSAGYGPKGEWRRAETYNDPLSNYPTHIEVHPYGEHEVRVTWRGVSIKPSEESLQGYIIRVWKLQEDVRSAKDTLTDKYTEAVVTGLQQQSVYVLRVLGYSTAGDGAISEAVYFSVLGGRIALDPTTSQICYATQTRRDCDSCAQFSSNGVLMCVCLLCLLWWR